MLFYVANSTFWCLTSGIQSKEDVMKKGKNHLVWVLALAMMLFAPLALCASPSSETTSSDDQVLDIAVFGGGYGDEYWYEIVELFEESHPGVTVNMQISPTIGQIITPQIAAGNWPDFMCCNGNDTQGRQYPCCKFICSHSI